MASLTSTTSEQELISPESSEHEALEAVNKLLGQESGKPLRLVADDGSEIELPNSLERVLRRAAAALASERTVAVEPFERLISIAEAARILNMSPAAVESVIDRKELTETLIDGRRMLDIGDIVAFGVQHHARMLNGLDELAQMSQEMGLYDLDRS